MGVITLLILVLMLIGLVVGIVLWTTAGSGNTNSEMSCGSCGYAVRGLTQLNCPECGADLREAGIGRGGSPGRRVAGMVLTIGCSFFLLMGCGLSMFVFLSMDGSSSHQPAIQSIPVQKSPSSSPSTNPIDQEAQPDEQTSPEPAP